jgi:hypothetical protein
MALLFFGYDRLRFLQKRMFAFGFCHIGGVALRCVYYVYARSLRGYNACIAQQESCMVNEKARVEPVLAFVGVFTHFFVQSILGDMRFCKILMRDEAHRHARL